MFTINQQPSTLYAMDPTGYSPQENKDEAHSQCGTRDSQSHQSCHSARLRRMMIPAMAIFLTLSAFLLLASMDTGSEGGFVGSTGGLLRRAIGNTTNGQQSPFVKNKLYLIVILVGLFLCLVAAVMLAACCCRSSFENPLCCPCYLCACCGGLACIECISCGLCAEALNQ
ncbi:hypothetical protein M422DRAFT_65224 [Sphaerobolus stellatus SS14]|nr:hypothetical protein M422DRAFT_65224 [Sphaerobolus stellatus SS14]